MVVVTAMAVPTADVIAVITVIVDVTAAALPQLLLLERKYCHCCLLKSLFSLFLFMLLAQAAVRICEGSVGLWGARMASLFCASSSIRQCSVRWLVRAEGIVFQLRFRFGLLVHLNSRLTRQDHVG